MNSHQSFTHLINGYFQRLLRLRHGNTSVSFENDNPTDMGKSGNKKIIKDLAVNKQHTPLTNISVSNSLNAKTDPKPKENSQTIGDRAEFAALNFLLAQGMKKLDTNYHSRYGEIDIVMADNRAIIFVEVRYRKHANFGSGAMTVTHNKQQKLIKTANYYLQQHQANVECRFDVIEMSSTKDDTFHFHWIKNAFM